LLPLKEEEGEVFMDALDEAMRLECELTEMDSTPKAFSPE
jgi:L-threo-3-deoxy-hexylosonate aldolase